MKITYLPQSDNFEKLKMRYDQNDKFEHSQNKQDDSMGSSMKSNHKRIPNFLLKQPMYDSMDIKIMTKPYKNSSPLKRNVNMNQIGEGKNDSTNLSKYETKVNETAEGLLNIIQKDTDSFYDNELYRKVSDNDGNLPNGLKLIVPPDKEPLLVYNSSEDTLTRRELEKRKKRSMQTNIDDDYFYYEEKLKDSSKPNFEEDNVKQKTSSGNSVDRLLKNPDVSGNIEISDTASNIATDAKPIVSTIIPVEDKIFVEPFTIEKIKEKPNGNGYLKDSMVKMSDCFNNKLMYAAKGKGSQKPGPGSKQSCHPSGGLPKNPGMPPLTKKGRDAEYEKLLKGDTSEKVIKTVLDKLNSNSQMSSELGICSFDIGELRSLFKQMRSSERKECCIKLRGEFKCFLNWLLTVEPSRKKRSDMMPDKTDILGSCNSQFPKFNIMGGGDFYRPSRQYESLAHKVEEYAEGENKL